MFKLSNIYPLVLAVLTLAVGCGESLPPPSPPVEPMEGNEEPSTIDIFSTRLDSLAKRAAADVARLPARSNGIPRSVNPDGSLHLVGPSDWTSGFYPGVLWYLYEHSDRPELRVAAEDWTGLLEDQQHNRGTHDTGFMMYCSYGNGYRITGNEAYAPILEQTARSLSSRFRPRVGCIRSWDWNARRWDFPVIIDNMMNLELLYAVSDMTGDTSFRAISNQHANTTLENHYRPDNSCWHVVDYNPTTGSVRKKETWQGLNDDSAWSRGQAWGLYGYVVAFRETGNEVYRDQAREIADFIFNHPNLPADLIPYWDFDATPGADTQRDVSAATVAASALIDLAKIDGERAEQYMEWADGVLLTLEDERYHTDVSPFFLDHSTGAVPLDLEVDRPINYGDYYYVEALTRRVQYAR